MKHIISTNAKRRIVQLVFLIALFSFETRLVAEEQEWEYVNTSSWKWSDVKELRFSSNSTSKLEV